MTDRYFGTDGIRGKVGEGKLTDENISKMAEALGAHFGAGSQVVIGRDTRESGPHLQSLIEKGLTAHGVNVIRLGVIPTPGTAYLTEKRGADFGIMITASHNPHTDNGAKLFNEKGYKLPDEVQNRIEGLIETGISRNSTSQGAIREDSRASHDYSDHLLSAVEGLDLSDLTIIVDTAHGAAYSILPEVLSQLGAKVETVGGSPNGRNINLDCGSTHPNAVIKAVLDHGADLGIALDGDADRLILIDSEGEEIDGDQIVARLARDWLASGQLAGDTVVTTVMSNMGLERYLESLDLKLERTAVGDRHVAAKLVDIGGNLGGETSGHILMTDYASTGDGCLAALMVLAGWSKGEPIKVFEPMPQRLENVHFEGSSPLDDAAVMDAINDVDESLGDRGRILVRASGTEPVIRVMAEGEDAELISEAVGKMCAAIRSAAG